MGEVITAHPLMMRMWARRYVDLYQEQIALAKRWYDMYVPMSVRVVTNEYITAEFARRGMV